MDLNNQYVILKYFYVLKHEQNNRKVNLGGLFTELEPQLTGGVKLGTARSWWEKWQYVTDSDDHFYITDKGENAYTRLEDSKSKAQTRIENADQIQDETLKDFRTKPWYFWVSILVPVLSGLGGVWLGASLQGSQQPPIVNSTIEVVRDTIEVSIHDPKPDTVYIYDTIKRSE